MATEVSVSDHPAVHEEVKEEIQESKPTEEVKDTTTPIVEETWCVTKETIEEKKPGPVNIEEAKKPDPSNIKELKKAEAPLVEEETLKSETMAPDNETKTPEVVTETVKIEDVKSPTEVPSVEPNVVEKTDDNKEITSKDIEQVAQPVADKKEDEAKPSVPLDEIAVLDKQAEIDEKKDHDEPKQSVPLDEIAVMEKEAAIEDTKEESAKETVVEEKPIVVEKESEEKGVESTQGKQNGGVSDEKPALEPVKTETKDEKSTETTPKEEEKTTPKQSSISLIGKVKKSFIKAKKAFTGKSNTPNKTPEAKEEDKDKDKEKEKEKEKA